MQVAVHKKGWMDEEGIYLFACLFSFRFVTYQITKHAPFARLFRTTIFIKVNDQHCVSFAWNRTSNCDKKKLFRENIRL